MLDRNKDKYFEEPDGLLLPLERKYEFKDLLGSGGSGKVYLVKHVQLGKELALKILDYYSISDYFKGNVNEGFSIKKERFITEAKILNKIKHPNVVEIDDIDVILKQTIPKHDKNDNITRKKNGQDKNIYIPFLTMKYIKGTNLKEIIKTGPLSLDLAISISNDILSALKAIHDQGIIHRDIKPANIILDEKSKKAILVDFGIAKDISINIQLTATGEAVGTPYYMSPEQINCKTLNNQTDIYSFGVVLFEMLSGKHPSYHNFKSIPDIRESRPDLPQGIQIIIEKAMAKDLQDRYETAAAFLADLNNIKKVNANANIADSPILIETPLTPAIVDETEEETIPASPRRSISPAVISIISAVLIIIIVIGLWLIFKPAGPDKHYRELIDSANRCIEKSDYKGAESYLKKALKIKETPEYRWLLETVDKKQEDKEKTNRQALQIARMKANFNKLQAALKGSASLDRKKEQCRAFLEKHKEIPSNAETTGMISEIQQSLADLEAAMQKAKQEKETPEVNQQAGQNETKKFENERNGTPVYDYIKDSMDIKKYLEFKDRYPESIHLPDLKNRLKAADQVLPPEEYWGKPIKKNQKGYYELLFGPGQNGHLMIYIPGKNYWIDKYEVSNLQFRNFLKAVNRKSSNPIGGDEYPAVVEYEEAENYCREYGFRLPTETEWEYASSAGKKIDYSWGNESPDANGIYRANFDSFDDGYKDTAPVKSFEKFSSPFGVVNMAGNVWEWIQGKKLKGGSYFSEIGDLKIEKSISNKSASSTGFPCGFRCLKMEYGD
jgi:serine/threonine protein kinase